MQTGKYAVLDIGTNIFKMIIVEVTQNNTFQTIDKVRVPVKIGRSGFTEQGVNPETEKKVLDAFVIFRSYINFHNVPDEHITAFATSAFRHAKGAKSLVQKIEQITNINVQVLFPYFLFLIPYFFNKLNYLKDFDYYLFYIWNTISKKLLNFFIKEKHYLKLRKSVCV